MGDFVENGDAGLECEEEGTAKAVAPREQRRGAGHEPLEQTVVHFRHHLQRSGAREQKEKPQHTTYHMKQTYNQGAEVKKRK